MSSGRPKQILTADLLPTIEAAIKDFGPRGWELRKLLAMRCAIRTTVDHAEEEHRISRVALLAAARALRQHGPRGLRAKKRPGKRRRLTPEQEATLTRWVEQRRDRHGQEREWTLKAVAAEVQQTFGVHYALSSMLKVLTRLGLSWKTGRPQHAKADLGQQAAFKKTCPRSSRPRR